MPTKSPAQEKLMQAAAHTKGRYGGVPQSVGKEFTGGGTPKHVHDPKTHADGHNSGHKKVDRMMKNPYHNEDQE